MTTNPRSPNQKNSNQDINVAEALVSNVAVQIEKNGYEGIVVQVDIDQLSLERQTASVFAAALILNREYDAELWACPYLIVGDIEEFAEENGMSLEDVKQDFISPGELEEEFGDYYDVMTDAIDWSGRREGNPQIDKTVEKINSIPQTVVRSKFENAGVDKLTEFLKDVIERLKSGVNSVFDNQVNTTYLLHSDNTEMSREEKVLFGRIAAYVLGHSGCRVGVWDGHVVAVDDVRMYANRHGFDPQEFVEQSWSQKEAEMRLTGDQV